jgi:hypothetical protein
VERHCTPWSFLNFDERAGDSNMKTGAFAAVLAAAWLNTSGIAAAAPVKTDSGLVEGASEEGVAAFLSRRHRSVICAGARRSRP